MRKKLLAAAVASSALVLTAPLAASADSTTTSAAKKAAGPTVTVVNRDVIVPFSLSISRGRVYVADSGTGKISKLVGGSLRTVITVPQPFSDIAGLDVSRNGRYLAYTKTVDEAHTKTSLEIAGPFGSRASADLAGYEATKNPDKIRHYGVDNPSKCVEDAFKDIPDGPPVTYAGAVDSHPYAVASVGRHWYVADAGGNDILRVSRTGRISTLAVLPRQPLKITAAIAGGLGLPDCVIGVTYNFESVPTDVELGRDGWLYVSILAGGPEDPSLGARSKVYRINPSNGRTVEVARGIAGATDLAVARNGKIYVTELFAGRVSVLNYGKPKPYVALPGAVSLEAGRDGLWAGTLGENGPGTIVHITR